MFHLKYFFYFIFLPLINTTIQINFYETDLVSENENDNNTLQHDCLRLLMYIDVKKLNRQIISFCMSEFPSKFDIEENDLLIPKYTFDQLAKENITSEQLYQWSASIDLIERYQIYLNNLSLSTEIFYNCTIPRFGPKCQYEFINYYPDSFLSLYDIISNFFRRYKYDSTYLTCYTHLQCYRRSDLSCLDWTDICDGKIDCLNNGIDEEQCWQLEINQCKENEYRCKNGQCIPKLFYQDNDYLTDCIDGSDESLYLCSIDEPPFGCDDVKCEYNPLTSSCVQKRKDLVEDAMYSMTNNSITEDCSLALNCLLNSVYSDPDKFCTNNTYVNTFFDACPDMLYFPDGPILFSNIYLAYKKMSLVNNDFIEFYICYNDSQYDPFFNMASKILFNNRTCYTNVTGIDFARMTGRIIKYDIPIGGLYDQLKRYHLIYNYTSIICNRSNMYQCINSSKCISIYRFMDTIYDCPYMDDEMITINNNNTNIEKLLKITHFKCQSANKYIPKSWIRNQYCDCELISLDWCEDEDLEMADIRRNISFQTICDQYIELTPVLINNQNETDETECQQWECNNIYTHCNGIWNCPNGEDEIGCNLLSKSKCLFNQHLCISPYTNQFMCLSIKQANDGKIDCLGGTDEPMLCRLKTDLFTYDFQFSCNENTSQSCISQASICDGKDNCKDRKDEELCDKSRTKNEPHGICRSINIEKISYIEKLLCEFTGIKHKTPIIYFTIDGLIMAKKNLPIHTRTNQLISQSSITELPSRHQHRCHHGLDLRLYENNSTKIICLCRPSFYGDHCQYQNQRINLAVQFRAFSDSWQTQFAIIILLIDDNDKQIIHSYEQINYLSMRDCRIKFNFYLLYSTRPKDPNKNYSIQIDFYEKISLLYRGSVLLPVDFSFLPVHRLAFIVDIPRRNDKIQRCLIDRCIHGKCMRYTNNQNSLSFCYCNEGWSGRYCTIQHNCTCSSDSLCIGITPNNRSICVCPINKFGSRCFLNNTACQNQMINSTCKNGGRCIVNDIYDISDPKFTCICRKGYSGEQCELIDSKLILSFDRNIILSQSLFIHFIEILQNNTPIRSTTLQTMSLRQNTMIIHWSQPFHIVFIEITHNKTYYLTIVQTIYHQSTTIDKTIHSSDRCRNISELFNRTFLQWHLIRRIKYYHLPCQQESLNLSCFYDDIHLCLCYTFNKNKRLANCFNFDHHMKSDCFGQSECENNGECFQDTPNCPRRSMCICPSCFYGRRCQFSTNGFGLSLDAIIGYHIQPQFKLIEQPFIIKMSLTFTIIFMIIGIINGFICLITFKNESINETGSRLYLLCSSIATLFITIILGLKFIILLVAQMKILSDRSFLLFQCHLIDFILRISLCTHQWLNACVGIERVITVIKDTHFNKKKSKQTAKFVIVILSIIIVGSCVHEPIYRRLIDEGNDDDDDNDDDGDMKRIWCIVSYSPNLRVYNYVINIFHFFGPFICNLISSIIFITKQSRKQSTIYLDRSFTGILGEQIQEYKRLLIAPIILVILALPRLIITFISKCMQSADDSWLFLMGYFISFIPPMLTFIIFILPSKLYKEEFKKSIKQYQIYIQRRLHLI